MRRKHVDGGARKEDSEGRCPASCFPLVEQPTHGFTSRGRGRQTGRFDELKSFKGQGYTGMAIGGTHHWMYESGRWPRKSRICGRYICCSNSCYAQGDVCMPQIKFEARKHR